MVLRVKDVPGEASFTSATLDEKSKLLNDRHEVQENYASKSILKFIRIYFNYSSS